MKQRLKGLFAQWCSLLSCREILSNPELLNAIEAMERSLSV